MHRQGIEDNFGPVYCLSLNFFYMIGSSSAFSAFSSFIPLRRLSIFSQFFLVLPFVFKYSVDGFRKFSPSLCLLPYYFLPLETPVTPLGKKEERIEGNPINEISSLNKTKLVLKGAFLQFVFSHCIFFNLGVFKI